MIDKATKKLFWHARVRSGDCLGHVRVLRKMKSPTGFLLCQGPLRIRMALWGAEDTPYLHCWLETNDTVIDLTRSPRFFDKQEYYEDWGVMAGAVKRYTIRECGRLGLAAGGKDSFWEFDVLAFQMR